MDAESGVCMSDTHSMEQIDAATLAGIQLERLKKTVRWAKDKSAFYQSRLVDVGLEEIEQLEDIGKLPFTTRDDIAKTSPFDFLTMPMSGLLRITRTGGDDEPIVKMYSPGDVANHVEMALRILRAAGVNRTSIVGVFGDMSDGELLDFQYAAEGLGALSIPLGHDLRLAIDMMEFAGMDTLIAGYSNVMQLIEEVQSRGRELSELTLRRVFCVHDMIQGRMEHVLDRMHVQVYWLYHDAGLGTAGVICDCAEHAGAHVQEDVYLTEIVEFGSSAPVVETGRTGELVVTTLVAEAMPLIRYRTGQAVMRVVEPCACGSKRMRLHAPLFRAKNRSSHVT